ncbi:MAG: CBS domain-containing protein, partial [Anaerolineae bacterium]
HRRDFTINTLAIRLDPQRWGELLDFYGGRADLEDGVIRVLHSLSFVDDPTRILRAARFEVRLGFQIDQRSEALIGEALPLLNRITGERIRHELDLIFEEAEPEAVLDRLEAFHALERIQPGLTSDAWLRERFRRLRNRFIPMLEPWGLDPSTDLSFLYWALFTYRLSDKDFERLRNRLKLPARLAELHDARTDVQARLDRIAVLDRPSAIAAQLDPCSLDDLALGWLVIDDPEVQAKLEHYVSEWREVTPILDGDDLKAMGFKPGPLFREILNTLRDARLDGVVHTREEEIALVEEQFGSEKRS